MLNKILIFVAPFAVQCLALVQVRGGGGNIANRYESDCFKAEPCMQECPPGWISKGLHCFFWSQDSEIKTKTWDEAEDFCRTSGAHLASVTTGDDLTYMRSKISNTTWIGATNQTENGTWVWTDCSEFDSQSQAEESKSCAYISSDGVSIVECEEKLLFVCKTYLCRGKK